MYFTIEILSSVQSFTFFTDMGNSLSSIPTAPNVSEDGLSHTPSNRIMSCERLPPELVEQIFDFLQQDKRALKACSLVCRAWLSPAYRRLFYETRLYSPRLTAAYGSPSKSTAAPFIRRLQIADYKEFFWNKTFPSLEGFDAVTSLYLETELPWAHIIPEIRSKIFDRFSTVTRLQIQKVVVTEFSELAELICSFRCLETLLLGATEWTTSNNASPSLRLPQNLRALELDRSDLTEILEWFCSFGQDLTLSEVCLLGPWERHCQLINTFLRVLGPCLESFRIRLQGVFLSSL